MNNFWMEGTRRSAFQTAIPIQVHAKSASYTEPMMEHCIINQQIKPFALAVEAVGKRITSYDPSCLVATESARSYVPIAWSRHQPARGSDGIQIPDRAPFGPTGARLAVAASGFPGSWRRQMADKFLALPILERFPGLPHARGHRPTVPFHRSIDPS